MNELVHFNFYESTYFKKYLKNQCCYRNIKMWLRAISFYFLVLSVSSQAVGNEFKIKKYEHVSDIWKTYPEEEYRLNSSTWLNNRPKTT